jgi:acetolactate synthase-1/2/3 large subunit
MNTTDRIVVQKAAAAADLAALRDLALDPRLLEDDFTDYTQVVVQKPWGYEYLIYSNHSVAVWILHLKAGEQTSMHCHPGKATSLVVLAGDVNCSTLESAFVRRAGQAFHIGRGVFHRTTAGSTGAYVMEVETPINKRDLARLADDYGRQGCGYESSDWLSRDVGNFNYFSAIDRGAYYNSQKAFADTSLAFHSLKGAEILEGPPGSLAVLLAGAIRGASGGPILSVPGEILELSAAGLAADATGAEVAIVCGLGAGVRGADLVIEQLHRDGVDQFFFVPEAVNAHLVDALVRNTAVRTVAFDGEGSACLAAEGYAKAAGQVGVLFVASGASALEAIAGVANAWVDSCPMLLVSAQSAGSHSASLGAAGPRQAANKTLGIVEIVRPVTKSAELITSGAQLTQSLHCALELARSGRPGPCWLDIPMDVLGGLTAAPGREFGSVRTTTLQPPDDLAATLSEFVKAKRPAILAGYGLEASGARADFRDLSRRLGIPVLLTRRTLGLLPTADPLCFGVAGAYGHRGANLILQNADFLLCLGARLSVPFVGRDPAGCASKARKVIIDIDPREMDKPGLSVHQRVLMDARDFCRSAAAQMDRGAVPIGDHDLWRAWCCGVRKNFPPGAEAAALPSAMINPCGFVAALSAELSANETIAVDGGFVLDCFIHAYQAGAGQLVISSPGLERPGCAIPAAIGASLAGRCRRVVVLTDTLGIHSMLPELRLVVNQKIPLKIFVFDAPGNPSLRRVHQSYFGGRVVRSPVFASWSDSTVRSMAQAVGLNFADADSLAACPALFQQAFADEEPFLARLRVEEDFQVVPRVALAVTSDGRWTPSALEDMYPHLAGEELKPLLDSLPHQD